MSGEWWRLTHQLVPNDEWTKMLADNAALRARLAKAVSGLEYIAQAAEERVSAMDSHLNSAWAASVAREALHKARATVSADDGRCESCDGDRCTAGPQCVATSNPVTVTEVPK